ncbi:MAG: hypothetical protein Q4E69_05225 [Bacilli bacterium]|nr:hypothetical protein [Bacilli bacterium]
MKKKEEKVGFDLSNLSLQELIEVYNNIEEFMQYLEENKIEVDDEKDDEDD